MEIMEKELKLDKFISFYESLTKDNLDLLSDIYAADIIFEDPAHRIEGFGSLAQYFKKLYLNVNECTFIIEDTSINQNTAFLSWRMQLSHPKLKKGELREVKGCSHIKFNNNLVIYQRDYFDLGEMLYEALPILGSAVKQIKKRLGQ